MSELLKNPYWSALCTVHAQYAAGGSLARRFPAEIIPFGGLAENSEAATTALFDLLMPGESILVTSPKPLAPSGLEEVRTFAGKQMILPKALQHFESQPAPTPAIELLGPNDVPAMVELKRVAFPGFFGPRAAVLGRFFGIRVEGELVAMVGERLALPGWREISALCTHPGHVGRGYAAALMLHQIRAQQAAGVRSFLGVSDTNPRAIGLYRRLGFIETQAMVWRELSRPV